MSSLRNILSRLVPVCLGILSGLLLAEIILHIIPEKQIAQIFYKKYMVYEIYQSDKEIGWIHIPGVAFRWNEAGEYDVNVTINSKGLRDREHTYQKPAGTFRILALGDSMTEAFQVPLEQAFVSALDTCLNERLERQVEVINGGTSSYGPGDELLFYTQEGRKYQPDLVLVSTFLANDFLDLERTEDDGVIEALGGCSFYLENGQLRKQWFSWADPRYEISPVGLFLRQNSMICQILTRPDSKIRPMWKSKVDQLRQKLQPTEEEEKAPEKPLPRWNIYMYAEGFPDAPVVSEQSKQMWALFEAVFLELRVQTMADGAHLAVVLLPAGYQVQDKDYEEKVQKYVDKWDMIGQGIHWDVTVPFRAMTEFLTGEGIPSLDLQPPFREYNVATGRSLFFEKDGHLNPEGHDLVARSLCDWLIEEELVH
jgi:lysophospholipase L1-like esterase